MHAPLTLLRLLGATVGQTFHRGCGPFGPLLQPPRSRGLWG